MCVCNLNFHTHKLRNCFIVHVDVCCLTHKILNFFIEKHQQHSLINVKYISVVVVVLICRHDRRPSDRTVINKRHSKYFNKYNNKEQPINSNLYIVLCVYMCVCGFWPVFVIASKLLSYHHRTPYNTHTGPATPECPNQLRYDQPKEILKRTIHGNQFSVVFCPLRQFAQIRVNDFIGR